MRQLEDKVEDLADAIEALPGASSERPLPTTGPSSKPSSHGAP